MAKLEGSGAKQVVHSGQGGELWSAALSSIGSVRAGVKAYLTCAAWLLPVWASKKKILHSFLPFSAFLTSTGHFAPGLGYNRNE